MSKERARARAAREAEAAQRSAAEQARREQEALQRAKRDRRALLWRRVRLWQHGTTFRRRREGWAALATLALVLIVLAYVFTGSIETVLFVVLVLIVGMPALVMLTFDRRHK